MSDATLGLTEEDRAKLAEWAENGGPELRSSPGERVELECEACGDTFEVPPSRSDEARFCSRACAGEARSSKVELACEACGDTFEVPPSRSDEARFCSRACAGEAQSSKVELACEACGDTFEVPPSRSDARFCSSTCAHESGFGARPPATAEAEGVEP